MLPLLRETVTEVKRSWAMDRPLNQYLHRLTLRHNLAAAERDALLAINAPVMFANAKTDLVRPGQVVGHACLVKSGLLARAEQFADGKRYTTAIFVPGDMADLHSVASPEAAWAITALTDCEYYAVPHAAIRAAYKEFPGLGMALWRDTIVDASILSKWASVLSRHSAPKRLAHLLCEYGLRMSAAGMGDRQDFELPLTQAQLAELLGLTVVHVQRTFRALRQEGLIATKRKNVRVLDLSGLERLAEFDDTYLMLPLTVSDDDRSWLPNKSRSQRVKA